MDTTSLASGSRCIRGILKHATQQLTRHSTTPALDAEILLCHTLEKTTSYLLAWPDRNITPAEQKHFLHLLQRRKQQEPIAYILGYKEFWSMQLMVSQDTLIPRPETELLVETALAFIPSDKPMWIADLGTGSGAIALAIAKERPRCHVVATDQSLKALDIAKKNAATLAVHNIEFRQGDWYQALPAGHSFDLIVSNPPYIAAHDPHLQTLRHEPIAALTPIHADPDGLSDIRTLIAQGQSCLKKDGYLLLEHGHDQCAAVTRLFGASHYTHIKTFNDLSGTTRLACAQK